MKYFLILSSLLVSTQSFAACNREEGLKDFKQASAILSNYLDVPNIYKVTGIRSIDFNSSTDISFIVRTLYTDPDMGEENTLKAGRLILEYNENCDLEYKKASLEL